jgi:flagellar hook-associated protein 2
MVGGISFGGLASGLDTGAIIDALLSVERFPITQLEQKKSSEQSKISLLGTLEGYLRELRSSAKGLATSKEFLDFSVTAELEGFATFGASGNAVAGAHTLEVSSLATSDRWVFDAVTDPTSNLATADGQSVQFTYDGTTYDVVIADQDESSLEDVAAAINEATDGAVSASVVNTGTAASPSYQLVLAGKDTGQAYGITGIASTITGLTINSTVGGPSHLTEADDAVAIIDGLTVRRSTNDFSDVLPGVSITVTGITASPVAFTVAPDKDAIRDKVLDFVDAYNKVIDFIQTQNSYDEESGAGGPLFGDELLRSVQSTLRTTLFGQSAAAVQSGFGTLSQIGIAPDRTGRMVVDQTKMDEKMDEDLELFVELFVDSDGFDNGGAAKGDPAYYTDLTADSGLADDLDRELDRLLNGAFTVGGEKTAGRFKIKKDALNDRIRSYDDQIEAREYRLGKLEVNLVARFAALENLMAQLNAQQGYLTSYVLNGQQKG